MSIEINGTTGLPRGRWKLWVAVRDFARRRDFALVAEHEDGSLDAMIGMTFQRVALAA